MYIALPTYREKRLLLYANLQKRNKDAPRHKLNLTKSPSNQSANRAGAFIKRVKKPPSVQPSGGAKPNGESILSRTVLVSLLLLLVTRPFSRDGGMAGDHGAQEAGQLPKAWTRDCKE